MNSRKNIFEENTKIPNYSYFIRFILQKHTMELVKKDPRHTFEVGGILDDRPRILYISYLSVRST